MCWMLFVTSYSAFAFSQPNSNICAGASGNSPVYYASPCHLSYKLSTSKHCNLILYIYRSASFLSSFPSKMLLSRIFSRSLTNSAKFSVRDIEIHKLEQGPTTEVEDEHDHDDLYRYLWIKCLAHNSPVLDSYEQFVKSAAKHLDINYVRTEEPWRDIRRRTMLASRHVHKKYRVQYETRTYYRDILFKNLTGSTADTFLEYVERNLPEGVLLIAEKHKLEGLPFEIQNDKTQDQ